MHSLSQVEERTTLCISNDFECIAVNKMPEVSCSPEMSCKRLFIPKPIFKLGGDSAALPLATDPAATCAGCTSCEYFRGCLMKALRKEQAMAKECDSLRKQFAVAMRKEFESNATREKACEQLELVRSQLCATEEQKNTLENILMEGTLLSSAATRESQSMEYEKLRRECNKLRADLASAGLQRVELERRLAEITPQSTFGQPGIQNNVPRNHDRLDTGRSESSVTEDLRQLEGVTV